MSIVDIHFHGTENLEINEAESEEQILVLAKEYGEQGIDGILFTLYPAEINKMRNILSYIKKAMGMQTEGARIYGAYLEGPFLNPNQAGALNRKYFLMPNTKILEMLLDGYEDVVKVITIAPELPGAIQIIEKCCERKLIVGMGHSDATFNEASEGFKAGARLITHLFNAMRGIHHREPGLAGFGLINEEVYVELIGDGRHLSDEILKWVFMIKNSDRLILVSDMVKDSGNGLKLKGGCLSLKSISYRLLQLNIDSEKINRAINENPLNLLQISFL